MSEIDENWSLKELSTWNPVYFKKLSSFRCSTCSLTPPANFHGVTTAFPVSFFPPSSRKSMTDIPFHPPNMIHNTVKWREFHFFPQKIFSWLECCQYYINQPPRSSWLCSFQLMHSGSLSIKIRFSDFCMHSSYQKCTITTTNFNGYPHQFIFFQLKLFLLC